MRKVIFLDKDGTLIPDIPYNVNPSLITLNLGVGEGLSILKKLGFEFILVSNQSGIAYNKFKEADLVNVIEKIIDLLFPWEIDIKAFYYCPHHPNGIVASYAINCDCRKPFPGLLKRSEKDYLIDMNKSWMIGDILNDVEAGKKAGCRSVLINNGNETEWLINKWRKPDYTASNFLEAAKHIRRKSINEIIHVQ